MRPVRSRKPCLGVLACAIAGILLAEWTPCSIPLALLAVLCFAAATFLGRKLLPAAFLVLTIFFIRHDLDWRQNPGRFPLDLAAQGYSVIQASGIVTSDAAPAGFAVHSRRFRFESRITQVVCRGRTYQTNFPVQIYWPGPPPAWGDAVTLTADIVAVPPARNPGEFDFSSYLQRRGIFAQLSCNYPNDCQIVGHGQGDWLLAWARDSRAFLQRQLTRGIADSPEIAGLIQTVTLGLKQETSVADRELFQHVGALHLFVVNGLHVALLAGILAFLLKPFGIHRRRFAVVIIPTLFAYALLTGANPGSMRAAMMAAVIFGAAFAERRPLSFNTLAAAAIVLLLWDTNELFQTGAQFSFGVVASIIFIATRIQRFLLPLGRPDPFIPRLLWTRIQLINEHLWAWFSGLTAVSIAASIGSFPFSAGYFNLATPSGFFANILLVPVATAILGESIFSILTAWSKSIALLFNNANWLLGWTMLAMVHCFALFPAGHFFISTSSSGPPECRLTILDLAPGQAIVIESQGAVWLVDCGNASAYYRVVRPYLESRGVNRLDGLILTHGAAASMGAAQEVIDDFAPRAICESTLTDRSPARRNLQASLEKAARPKSLLESGDQLQISPAVTCTVMFPPADFPGRTALDKSLVLRIQYGVSRILLMSDSAYSGEHWLLENQRELRASAVIIDGQSRDLAGADEFITTVHPIAVIRGEPGFGASEGANRHWAASIYKDHVIPFLQSQTGGVTIDLTPSSIGVSGFLNHQSLVRRSD